MDGIDRPAVTAWFQANVPGVVPPLSFERLHGRQPNLTLKVTDGAGSSWWLRRPPLGTPEGHAQGLDREHRILTTLADSPVPAPVPVAFCPDPSVTGAVFSVLSSVEGHVLVEAEDAEKLLDEDGRRTASETLVDALADLHAVDIEAAGLADLAAPRGYVERQLVRWDGYAEQAQEQAGRCVLLLHDLHWFLAQRQPAEAAVPSLVHGEYRLDSVVVGDDGRVRAVLDWERTTLGDPLVDLGQLMVIWTGPGQDDEALGRSPTALPGFLTRSQVAARYGQRSGRDLDHLDFYVGFAYWKLACILEGVYAGHRAAGTLEPAPLQALGAQVVRLTESARETLGGP